MPVGAQVPGAFARLYWAQHQPDVPLLPSGAQFHPGSGGVGPAPLQAPESGVEPPPPPFGMPATTPQHA
jgi:hypothetical protein